jgi:hypothetical protein
VVVDVVEVSEGDSGSGGEGGGEEVAVPRDFVVVLDPMYEPVHEGAGESQVGVCTTEKDGGVVRDVNVLECGHQEGRRLPSSSGSTEEGLFSVRAEEHFLGKRGLLRRIKRRKRLEIVVY